MNPIVPAPYVILFTVVLAVGAGWLAWRSAARTPRRIRLSITTLRSACTAVLILLALNWGRWQQEVREQDRHLAVLVDASASMETADVDGDSRWRAARAAVTTLPDSEIADRRIRLFAFSDHSQAVAADLPASMPELGSERTDILATVDDALQQFGNNGLAGIVVISDGRQLDNRDGLGDVAIRARSLGIPIAVLPLGGDVPARDLVLSTPRQHLVAFTGQPLQIQSDVTNQHLGPRQVVVRLLAEDIELSQQVVQLDSGDEKRLIFDWEPPVESRYVELKLVADTVDGETIQANNVAHVGVSVLEERIRVLMLEGQPFWDSKFLAQLIREHANFEYDGTYRVSRDRVFQVRGEEQETQALDGGDFPETHDELRAYDLIILGRGMSYFLDDSRAAMLSSFVRDHGGGVIFARGKSYDGEFPALAEIEPATWGPQLSRDLRWRPTEQGVSTGLFGDMLPGAQASIWDELPPLTQVTTTRQVHPFTQVLASGYAPGEEDARGVPLVLMRRHGQGMVLTVTADNFWQWDFFPDNPRAKTFYRDFWTQVVQWATTYADYLPGQDFALRLDRSSLPPGQPARIRIARRQESSSGELRVLVHGPTNELVATLTPNRLDADSREYMAVFSSEQPGLYRLDLQYDGTTVSRQLLQVLTPPAEDQDLSAAPDFLAALANQSGGQVLTADTFADAVEQMLPVETAIDPTRRRWAPYWANTWCLLAALLLMLGEVFLRRRNGLL